MDADEWQACDRPSEMFRFLRTRSLRKMRIFCAACCRRRWSDLPPGGREVVEAAERYADGGSRTELDAAAWRAIPAYDQFRRDTAEYALGGALLEASLTIPSPARCGEAVIDAARKGVTDGHEREPHHIAELVRDVFGNPFRPVAFSPNWRTEAVVALARTMYDARDFAPLPVLADALDDAGCDHADLLAHCRGPGPHVRGCWVVDLVLGKV